VAEWRAFRFLPKQGTEEGIMGRLLAVLVVLVVGVAALGYYQGWFKVSKAQTEQGQSVTVAVDKDKIEADKKRAKEKVQDVAGQIKEKAKGATDNVREEAATKKSDHPRE
jgi:hypothetical protein